MTIDIYDALKFAGARLSHHESDLYVKADPVSRRIIREALADGRLPNKPTLFQATDGSGLYFEIPFGYQPFWDDRLGKSVSA